ncbi:MAG: 3-hydroxyacyl-ACP dehydratase FabZ [Chloroflexota bacterium]|nr:3-hydroxyacyl-ACP dehydratase FabZ [Chloroflexota bacterium]
MLSAADIQQILPHRYPFLLVDQIIELEEGHRAVGLKGVTINEQFFAGHFPAYPVMPGVLIAEALAQVGAIAVLRVPEMANKIPFLVGLDNFRFKHQVVPGNTIRLEVTLSRLRSRAGRGHGVATVDGIVAAEGDITFVVADATAS